MGALPQTPKTLGRCPKPRRPWGAAPNPEDLGGAAPNTPPKTLGRCPKPRQGISSLGTRLANALDAFAGKDVGGGPDILEVVQTPCKIQDLGDSVPDAPKTVGLCPTPCQGISSLGTRMCRGIACPCGDKNKIFRKKLPLMEGECRSPIHKRFLYFALTLPPQTHAYAFAISGSRGVMPLVGFGAKPQGLWAAAFFYLTKCSENDRYK